MKSNIEIDVTYIGAGWEDITLMVNGKRIELCISTYFNEVFSMLLCALYYLHPLSLCDSQTSEASEYNNMFDYVYDEDSPPMDIPYKVEFSWNNDIYFIANWRIQRPQNEEEMFDLEVYIEYEDETNDDVRDEISFNIAYNDFCYSVIKAIDKMLKEYGIVGFNRSVFFGDLNLRYFLRLKAYLLRKEDYLELTNREQYSLKTSLEKELELLMMRME